MQVRVQKMGEIMWVGGKDTFNSWLDQGRILHTERRVNVFIIHFPLTDMEGVG